MATANSCWGPRVAERLTIGLIGHRGDGVADTPGGPVYVPYTLPSETVTVEAIPGSPNRRQLLDVEVRSPERAVPISPFFGTCGGCSLQHWALPKQQEWKRQRVIEALTSVGIAANVGATIDAHGEGRRRVVLHARRQDGALKVGFAAARSHAIVPIDHCPILAPEMSGAIGAAQAIAQVIGGGKPLDIQITASDTGLDVDVRGSGALNAAATTALAKVAEAHNLARITRHGEMVTQRTPPTLAIGSAVVPLPPGAFLQATAAAEDALAALVLEYAGKAKNIADLFCGIGPFALRLAKTARVTAADSDQNAIEALKRAAASAKGLKPVTPQARDLFRRPFVPVELKAFDAVVFDPPRQGAQAQARELAACKVPLVVAVSCDADTFARDARTLIDGGYTLDAATPVDQFRYSVHIEIVARFRKR
jgi:23S rRNA (uracil1939-C5)-methyltransferase